MSPDPHELAPAGTLPDDLSAALDQVRPDLERVGTTVYFLPSTTSTNDVAARLADAGVAEGTTVVADTQTSGRGRLGRTWFSPPGAGLYVSVVLRLNPMERRKAAADARAAATPLPARITLLAGVAAADAVRTATGLPVEIKWPNDLVFGGRKLAGILAEASVQNGAIEYIILGVGLNIRAVAYPPDIARRASSIEAELGREVDRGAVLAALLLNLDRARSALRRDDLAGWFTRWRAWSPSATGALVEWRAPDGVRRGRTAGLDTDGALLVEANRGLERVMAGEVVWL